MKENCIMIITRPFECKEDHSKCTHFAVVGKTQIAKIKTIEWMIKDHLTPHFISFVEPIELDPVPVSICCAIIGCGIENFENEKGETKLRVKEVKNFEMPRKTLDALINFTDTGYEIG